MKGTDKLVKDHMADSEFSMDAPRMSSQKFKDPTFTSENQSMVGSLCCDRLVGLLE
jgi:hypothetical protein